MWSVLSRSKTTLSISLQRGQKLSLDRSLGRREVKVTGVGLRPWIRIPNSLVKVLQYRSTLGSYYYCSSSIVFLHCCRSNAYRRSSIDSLQLWKSFVDNRILRWTFYSASVTYIELIRAWFVVLESFVGPPGRRIYYWKKCSFINESYPLGHQMTKDWINHET